MLSKFENLWATFSWCLDATNQEVEDNPAETWCQNLVFIVAGRWTDDDQVSMIAEAGHVWMIADQAELTECRVIGEGVDTGETNTKNCPADVIQQILWQYKYEIVYKRNIYDIFQF